MIGDLHIVSAFICHFWFVTFLSSQKLKNVRYNFWLQKEVKRHIRFVFSIHNSPILGGFICYFWFIFILLRQNLKNVKYRFWLQKGIKKLNLIDLRNFIIWFFFIMWYSMKQKTRLTLLKNLGSYRVFKEHIKESFICGFISLAFGNIFMAWIFTITDDSRKLISIIEVQLVKIHP